MSEVRTVGLNEQLKKLASDSSAIIIAQRDSFRELVRGRRVRIVSDYNGQSFGSSRRSARDRICTVKSASWYGQGWSLQLEEYANGHPFVRIDEVEFVELDAV